MTDNKTNGTFGNWLHKTLKDHYFKMKYSYYGQAPDYWRLKDRTIDCFHMILILQGKGRYTINEQDIELSPGRFLFVSPRIVHHGRMDSKAQLFFGTARFSLSSRQTGREVSDKTASDFWFTMHTAKPQICAALFERLNTHHTSLPEERTELVCSTILQQIMAEMALEEEEPQQHKRDRIDEVQRFIRNNPQDRCRINELAKMAGLSLRHFNIQFRKRTGYSPNDYRIMARCEKARQLLTESEMNIKQITYSLGYPNQYAFSLQFSRTIGMSPSQYKRAGG